MVRHDHLLMKLGLLCLLLLMVCSQYASAAVLSCGPIYASRYALNTGAFSNQLYTLAESNGAATLVANPQPAAPVAVIAQATNTNIYFDNGSNATVRQYTGSATTSFATTYPSWSRTGSGGAFDGNVYYVGLDFHLYRQTPTGAVSDVGLLTAITGDTVFSTLNAGDIAGDGNGRLYMYSSVGGTGLSYLYRIDVNTLKATLMRQVGPNGASGLAFTTTGQLFTTSIAGTTTSPWSINLGVYPGGATDLGTVTGLGAGQTVYDLASCNLPVLNPVITTTKAVANITTGQNPATTAVVGNVLEYTVTITNSGNLVADSVTLSDAIPTGTTYVAGSTTLNGVAVADVGGKMPYDPTSTGTREVHTSTQPSGVVQPGGSGVVTVKFRVTVAAGAPATVSNVATSNYPTVSGGVTTFNNAPSNPATVSTNSDMGPPVLGALPAVLSPGQTYSGLTLTCTNAGPAPATNASCAPSASAGSISALSCSPTPPATVAAGAAISCTFSYTAPGTAGGTNTPETAVTFTGTTGASNDSNGGTTTGGNNTTTASPVAIIDAVNDSATVNPGDPVTILGNDQLGSVTNPPVGAGGISTPTIVSSTLPGATINGSNQIVVPTGTAPGTYTVDYQICAQGTTVCDSATATITVNAVVVAQDDTMSGVSAGSSTASVLADNGAGIDTVNGAQAVIGSNVALSNQTGGTFPSGGSALSVNTTTGQIDIPANAVPGAYTVPYQICSTVQSSVCDSAVATVVVVAVDPKNDAISVSPDTVNPVTTPNVLADNGSGIDTIDGVQATLGGNATLQVSGTGQTGTTLGALSTNPPITTGGITFNADGTFTVEPNTTAGSYVYVYELCSTSPVVCKTAQATVVVGATVPITLSSVEARQTPSGLAVVWTTATETQNAGFHLYARKAGETEWRRLSAGLIPSQVVDSLEPQRYSATFTGVQADELLVEDWDTQGQTQRHGPFTVGRLHGFDAVAAAKPIDWQAIHAENAKTLAQNQATQRRMSAASAPEALLWVKKAGVQRISFNELQAAGANFNGVAIADLALSDNGKKYPRYVIDANRNGQFDSGDSVEFLGQLTPTLYSNRNAYRLSVDRRLVNAANSDSLDAKNAVPGVFSHTIQVEQQSAYSFAAPGKDPFYDARLIAYTSPVSLDRSFNLPGYAGGTATLTLRQWGVTAWPGTAPDHHLIVKVNGQQVDEAWFDDNGDFTRTITLSGLQTTANKLTLVVPGDTGYPYDIQTLDGFTVQYPRQTQADNGAWAGDLPGNAKILIGGFQGESVAWLDDRRLVGAEQLIVRGKGLWVAADSRALQRPSIQADVPTPVAASKGQQVDYLIVSHPLFSNSLAMNDLVALQQARGYRTAVVNVDAIYAAYSDFEVSSDAIAHYIKQAKPRFVLLVGSDSYDYHNYLGLASQSFIPTYYAATVAPVTYAPADSRYVEYNNDGRPQAALGRLPVRTVVELTQMVTKLVNYVPPTHGVFSAGPSDGGSRQFSFISQGYAAQLPTNWTRQLVAVDDLGLAPAKTALQTELNLPGALVSYMGHSSYAIWGLNPTSGILLSASEARQVSNSTPHLITQWGCWNTYFVNPKQDTMANAFLLQARGAAAVLGATALSDVGMLTGLGKAFFSQLGQSATLGEALQAAQQTYLNQNPVAAGKLRGFALLGDPAAQVR